MSKTSGNPTSSAGLMPLDAEQSPQNAGVFRLEAMAPGVENAQAALQAPRKSKLSTQALVLGVLLVIGAGLIYGMRLLGIAPLKALADITTPQYDLTKSADAGIDHRQLIKDLQADFSTSQVPLDQVQKNPFRMAEEEAETSTITNNTEAGARAAADRALRAGEAKKQKIQMALSTLKLNGVLGGSTPVARISGDAVRVGETVGEMFIVKAIHGRSVELEFEGQTYELRMDDDNANSTRPRRK